MEGWRDGGMEGWMEGGREGGRDRERDFLGILPRQSGRHTLQSRLKRLPQMCAMKEKLWHGNDDRLQHGKRDG